MGAVPSRESLLRGLIRVTPNRESTDHTAATSRRSAWGSAQEMVLVPLIPDYFPSAEEPSFLLLFNVYKEASLCCDCVHEEDYLMNMKHLGTERELYEHYMHISKQRLFETDSELIAVHRAGRVFSAVPCAVAFVQECGSLISSSSSSSPAPCRRSPLGQTIPTVQLHGLHLYIVGFIGDTNLCPPSIPQNKAKDNPFRMLLLLSKSVGGNQRMLVTSLAAYTLITQLRRIGIVDDPMMFAYLHSAYNGIGEQQQLGLNSLQLKEGTASEGQEVDKKWSWKSMNISGHVIFRPLEFTVALSDIPWLCYVREFRARLSESTLDVPPTIGNEKELLLSADTLTKHSLKTFVESDSLCGTMDAGPFKKCVEWACWHHETRFQSLVGAQATEFRAALAKENLKCVLEGNVFVDSGEPTGAQRGDVWIVGSDSYTRDRIHAAYTPVTRGCVMSHDGSQWCLQPDRFAEEILLSVFCDECKRARTADPDDPHWMRGTDGSLLCSETGLYCWKFVRHGLTLVYSTVPGFAKQRSRKKMHATLTHGNGGIVSDKPANSVGAKKKECGRSPSLNHSGPFLAVGRSSVVGLSRNSLSFENAFVGSHCESPSQWGAASYGEGGDVSCAHLSSEQDLKNPMRSFNSCELRNAVLSPPRPVSHPVDVRVPTIFSSQSTQLSVTAPAIASRQQKSCLGSFSQAASFQAGTPKIIKQTEHCLEARGKGTDGSTSGGGLRAYDREGKFRWEWGRRFK
ncbi:hypothetical protein TcBrA4_0078520 [Trypanosoma cruzi]|nr:hypothetical protein TcBrA4_0078520 [Trypanosoma cruzi]